MAFCIDPRNELPTPKQREREHFLFFLFSGKQYRILHVSTVGFCFVVEQKTPPLQKYIKQTKLKQIIPQFFN